MDSTIMFEFPVASSELDSVGFSFLSNFDYDNSTEEFQNSKNNVFLFGDMSISAQVEGKYMNGYNFDYGYDSSFEGGTLERSGTFTYGRPDSELVDEFESNVIVKKVEFDHENGNVVAVRVEFQADTEEGVEKIKNKAKAYGLKVK